MTALHPVPCVGDVINVSEFAEAIQDASRNILGYPPIHQVLVQLVTRSRCGSELA